MRDTLRSLVDEFKNQLPAGSEERRVMDNPMGFMLVINAEGEIELRKVSEDKA